jgi:hypothetical protein
MINAAISKYGDRKQENGCKIHKIGMNIYRLRLPKSSEFHVFVETKTQFRTAVVHRYDKDTYDIRTFNLLNGYHPGSDLIIRAYTDSDPELLYRDSFDVGTKKLLPMPLPDGQLLVQAHSRDFRLPVIEQTGDRVSIETLITRTPPTPVETNIEIAVVRSLGPLRSR